MIRPAKRNDSKAILALNRPVQALHSEKAPWLIKKPSNESDFITWFTEELGNSESLILVAEHDGEVIGYLYGKEVKRDESWIRPQLHYFMIHHISVTPSSQRCGFGNELMQAMIEEAQNRDIDRIELEVWNFNEKARRFFSNFGFENLIRRKTLEIKK